MILVNLLAIFAFWNYDVGDMTLGIDEVGRGCWAGPVVAGAVVLDKRIRGLKDSKKLTKQERERLDVLIRKRALAIGIGWASPQEIDELGLTKAVSLAMERAVAEITTQYEEVIIDGNYNFLKHLDLPNVQTIIKADDKIAAVSAASIVAKVARDNWMATHAAAQFPHYSFEKHVGYGTPHHRAMIELHGLCDLHRRRWAPVRLKAELAGEQL